MALAKMTPTGRFRRGVDYAVLLLNAMKPFG
jgi:hypothetical protein